MSFSLQLAADLVEVEAGATTPVTLTILGKGAETDRFELEVDGIDPEWKAIPVPVFTVEPGEAHPEKLFFKPPRASESLAGNYPFVVRVRSLNSGEQKTIQGVLKVKPFNHLSMEIDPKKGLVSPTTKRNHFTITLVNLGNTEHTVRLTGNDPDDECAFDFDSEQVTVGPGQQKEVEVHANPTKPRILSSGRLIGFSITARSVDVPSAMVSAQAQLEQRSLISPATLIVAFLLAVTVFAWFMMMPKPPGVQLTVSPMRATLGQEVTVRWSAHDASRVSITAGSETIYDGPELVSSMTFKVNSKGALSFIAIASKEGRASAPESKSVLVDEPVVSPDPEILSFKASTKKIKFGTSLTFSWTVNDATTKVALTPVKDELSPSLQDFAVTPTQSGPQEFTLIAFNKDGKSVRSKPIRIEVVDESDAAILAFEAKPDSVKEEDPKTILTWQVSNAVRVELKPDKVASQTVNAIGSQEFDLTEKTTFTLTAWDTRGRTAVRKITVNFTKTPVVVPDPGLAPTDPNLIPPPATTSGGGRL